MTEFGSDYAKVYDAIYRSKDYDGEVNLIERILVSHGFAGSRRLLDLGCGTGAHALRLAERGHSVAGVDRSSPMLAEARAKMATAFKGSVEFHQSDIRELDLCQRFDAVLMMFTVLGYQLSDADLMAALASVRRHLEPSGLFVFDVWHGPAVVAECPSTREIEVKEAGARISRKTRASVEIMQHLCRVVFDLARIDAHGRVQQWQEEHVVRYYFKDGLETALTQNKLELVSLRSFPDFEAPADERAWNVIGVARAV